MGGGLRGDGGPFPGLPPWETFPSVPGLRDHVMENPTGAFAMRLASSRNPLAYVLGALAIFGALIAAAGALRADGFIYIPLPHPHPHPVPIFRPVPRPEYPL